MKITFTYNLELSTSLEYFELKINISKSKYWISDCRLGPSYFVDVIWGICRISAECSVSRNRIMLELGWDQVWCLLELERDTNIYNKPLTMMTATLKSSNLVTINKEGSNNEVHSIIRMGGTQAISKVLSCISADILLE